MPHRARFLCFALLILSSLTLLPPSIARDSWIGGCVLPLNNASAPIPQPQKLPKAVAATLRLIERETGAPVALHSLQLTRHREKIERTLTFHIHGRTWKWSLNSLQKEPATRLMHVRLENPHSIVWEGIVRFGRASPLCIQTPHDGIFFLLLD